MCLLSFDVGLNQGGAGPGPLFALFNTQYPSPSLFLSLHPSLAAFTCTMSARPSVDACWPFRPVGRVTRRGGRGSGETRERKRWVARWGREGENSWACGERVMWSGITGLGPGLAVNWIAVRALPCKIFSSFGNWYNTYCDGKQPGLVMNQLPYIIVSLHVLLNKYIPSDWRW